MCWYFYSFENKDEFFFNFSKKNDKHTPTLILEFQAIYPVCSNSDVLTMVKREGGIECACINARACSADGWIYQPFSWAFSYQLGPSGCSDILPTLGRLVGRQAKLADGLLAGRLRIDGHGTCVRTHTGYATGVLCGFFVLDILIRIFRVTWMDTPDIPRKFADLRERHSLWIIMCFTVLLVRWNLDLRIPDLRKHLDLRKIVATTDFLAHKLFDLRKIF